MHAQQKQLKQSPLALQSWWRSTGWLIAIAAIMLLAGVATESVVALAIVLLDGTVAIAVVASAALAGGWLMRFIRPEQEDWPTRLICGGALGIGILALLVFALGKFGWLNRPVAFALVGFCVVAGITRFAIDLRTYLNEREAGGISESSQNAKTKRSLSKMHWLWLAAVPFFMIALLGNCLPPGILWAEEAYGYDILEYHLAVPKIFFEQGQITFLPNNVYSNFPLSAEMLWLLIMTLHGAAVEAVFMAKTVNAALGFLFVAAAWMAGRSFSPRCGIIAGVCAATAPWIAYLAGIAYVETGMLAMGMAALAALLYARRENRLSYRWILIAGLLAGFCCGFKYTAAALIALPLAVPLLFASAPWRNKIIGLAIFLATTLAAFSPWLIRNQINTGNPVFPLAWSVFGANEHAWDADLQQRWAEAHGLSDALKHAQPLWQLFLQRSVLDFRLGPAVLLLAAVGIIRHRDRLTLGLAVMLMVQLVIWGTATHIFARFSVAILLPLVILAGRSVQIEKPAWPVRLLVTALLIGVGVNLYHLGDLYYDHTRVASHSAQRPINQLKTVLELVALEAYGHTDWFVSGQWPGTRHFGAINNLPVDKRVMLVGEARTFYIQKPCVYAVVFNRHPLSEMVGRYKKPTDVISRLQQDGITHILVHWMEMQRLQGTYGFDPEIDRDLFDRLTAAGLKVQKHFFLPPAGKNKYATLYEVPQHE